MATMRGGTRKAGRARRPALASACLGLGLSLIATLGLVRGAPPTLAASPLSTSALRGVLDWSFGHHGIAYSPPFRRVGLNSFYVLLRQPNGDLIVQARRQTQNERRRCRPFVPDPPVATGSRDPSFSPETEVAPSTTSSQVALPDGSLLALGAPVNQPQCGSAAGAVRKLEPDGDLDPTFGEGGCAQLPFRASWIAT